MTIFTTMPGAVIGSETDVLPPKRPLALDDAPQGRAGLLDSDVNAMLHRITDLAIDVTAAGRYVADAEFRGHTSEFTISTLPAGGNYGGLGHYRRYVYLDLGGPDETLREMITHLEALLAEGHAESQEGQPS